MKAIDEQQLEADLVYRFQYLADFIGFGTGDAAAILASAPYLGPLIPQMVDKTYEKLLAQDATARHFVPQQSGCEGAAPQGLGGLTATHPQIQFRKEHLVRYFMQILGRACDVRLVPYLDMVGKIHTARAGNPEIEVPLVQMNALMGFLSDVIAETIAGLPLDPPAALRTMRAFQKFLWIQNDFITRQYTKVAT